VLTYLHVLDIALEQDVLLVLHKAAVDRLYRYARQADGQRPAHLGRKPPQASRGLGLDSRDLFQIVKVGRDQMLQGSRGVKV
jgi:hypothetical protein